MCAKIFLECKMNQLNSRGTLSWAAENGHEGIVKLLLEWGHDSSDQCSEAARVFLGAGRGCGFLRAADICRHLPISADIY